MIPRFTQEEEVGIIKEAQAGSEPAFNKLFYAYKEFVENLLNVYIEDEEEARDLANEVFMKVYEKLSTFKDYSSFGGWIRTIAKNTAIDYIRDAGRREVEVRVTDDGLSEVDLISSKDESVVDFMSRKEIQRELKALPETTRKVLWMFYGCKMRTSDISKMLRIPEGTIKSILFRTREQLRETFKKFLS